MACLTRRIVICGTLLLTAILTQNSFAQQVTAIAGEPWGVGRVVVTFPRADMGDPVDSEAFSISDPEGRIFYPVFKPRRFLPLLQSLLGADTITPPQELEVLFLFRGNTPLELTVKTPTPQKLQVVPRQRRDGPLNNLTNQWWRTYNEVARQRTDSSDHPPVLETYLSMMLSDRLGLAPPPLSERSLQDRSALEPSQSLSLLMGTEKVHDAMLKAIMNNELTPQGQLGPVVPPIQWAPLAVPQPSADVEIEPMASYVPEECFYVRFGSLTNYLWLNKLLERNGGDLSRMISNRRVAFHLNEVVQRQLALKQSELAEIFGDKVVQDVALIGRDTYTREGAALGMLFHARQSPLLVNDINKNRQDALKKYKREGAKLETVTIAGQEVSFLSTPDNTLRSFYVARGDFHLVTTSQAIIERFLSLETNPTSLANSREFQYARGLMPVSRDDTVFVYLSSQFFRGLYSPQYRVEIRRRLQSVIEMELQQMATAAATHEGFEDTSVEGLIAAGFLPPHFGKRADGSHTIISNDTLGDSIRGGRGHFVPIPDMEIVGMTQQETADFNRLRQFHMTQWRQMNPIVVGINRFKLNDEGLERIAIDARVTPFQRSNYSQFLSFLGPPLPTHIATTPQDVVAFQAVLDGRFSGGTTHYAVAVQDLPFPLEQFTNKGFFNTLRMIQATPGYLTAFPKPGLLDQIPFIGASITPDINGYSQLPFGLLRREYNGFSTLSFHPEILADVTPNLAIVEDSHPAQVRIHVGDISNAQITPLANGLAQSVAKRGSLANAAFFQEVSNQLGIPESQAKAFADQLLNLEFIDPLGGEYVYQADDNGNGRWVSTAWSEDGKDFQANVMDWFRGLEARLNVDESLIELHAQFDMQNEKPQQGLKLPGFNLFDLGGAFGGSKKKESEEKPKTPPPITPKAEELPEPIPPPAPLPEPAPSGKQF
ncbi:hypothetical protein C5Y96_23945 [Blastopirellula marina]|uniref:Uncharacterized protein n=1 Tax=Blastopirellula marina TaxID=124 RepID=A0A2S8EZP3_9BACT|nr:MULTISPECIES: hypothetical protein [Pirellulaceae]PQO25396.1 hypothetical protein C5Y96_23945 [Blastopirellula marina]RCS42360.1 hypothetical protein DTL36_23995 [Bremerella cremea]